MAATEKGAAEKKKRKYARKPGSNPPGRPTTYTDEIGEAICERLATGESLRSICDSEGMPAKGVVFQWLWRQPKFADRYAQAKAAGCYAVEEELFEISDDGTNDWMEKQDKNGDVIGFAVNGEAVQRSRLRVETRRWYLERIQARRFGAKAEVTHDVKPESPLASLMQQLAGKTIKPVAE